MAQASDSGAFPFAVERELVGICKASMVRLQSQLSQYIQQVHNAHSHNHTQPLLYTALHELYYTTPVADETTAAGTSISAPHSPLLSSDAQTVHRGADVDGSSAVPMSNGKIEMLNASQANESQEIKQEIMSSYEPTALDSLQSVSYGAETSNTYNDALAWTVGAEASGPPTPTLARESPLQPPYTSAPLHNTARSVQSAKKVNRPRVPAACTAAQPGKRHPHKCTHCPATFAKTNNLHRHLRSIHGLTDKIYRCAESGCMYTTLRSDRLKQHYTHRHPDRQPLNYSQMFTRQLRPDELPANAACPSFNT